MLRYFTPDFYESNFLDLTATSSVRESFGRIKKLVGSDSSDSHILVTGEEGIGKSHLFAWLKKTLSGNNFYFLG